MHFSRAVRNLIQKQNITNCKSAINGGINLSNSSISQCSRVKSLHLKCSFLPTKNVFDFSRNFSKTPVFHQRSAQDKEKFKNYVTAGIMIGASSSVFITWFLLKKNYDDVYIEYEKKE